jgi:DNA-binding MarR family transcriptional regulator
MSTPKRKQLSQDLNKQIRFLTANSVVFSKLIADRVGQHATDLECLDFLILNGPATAGKLAELTGLTTGAVTAVIDRLEKAGYARRERDLDDRRKVIVIPNEPKIYKEVAPFSESMGVALEAISQEFSESELDVILHFLAKANAAANEEIVKLRSRQA